MIDLLRAYGELGVELLKGLVPKVTGKTASSIRYVATENRLTIYGRAFFRSMETGRAPRRSSSYGGFDEHLEDWLKAKGFPTKTTKSGKIYYKIGPNWYSAESLAWKINKTGDKTFRQGGRDIYFAQLEKFVKELTKKVAQEKSKEYAKKLKMVFNGTFSS